VRPRRLFGHFSLAQEAPVVAAAIAALAGDPRFVFTVIGNELTRLRRATRARASERSTAPGQATEPQAQPCPSA
jgi:hypothetical protein